MRKKGAVAPASGQRTRLGYGRRAAEANMAVSEERAARRTCKSKAAKSRLRKGSGASSSSDAEENYDGRPDPGANTGGATGSCGTTVEAMELEGKASVAESGHRESCDLEMPAGAERAAGIVDTETVLSAKPVSEETGAKDCNVASGSLTIEYDTIIKGLNELKCLETKHCTLAKGIDLLIRDLKLLKGQRRTDTIRELAYLNKELEETEAHIKSVLTVLEPWKELYDNKKNGHTNEQPSSTHANEQLSTVCANVQPAAVCANVPTTSVSANVQPAKVNGKVQPANVRSKMQPANLKPIGVNAKASSVNKVQPGGVSANEKGANVSANVQQVGANAQGSSENVGTGDSVWGKKNLFDSVQSNEEEEEYGKRRNVPRLCFKCGARTRLAGKCSMKKCAFCGETGHISKDCVNQIRCNLCLKTGHAYRNCPEAWCNVMKSCPNLEEQMREEMTESVPVIQEKGGAQLKSDRHSPKKL
ncbi:hypothetical protein XELAEV_18047937mg [Xenopus laevis]|uniref:CCHC-type domain-containing protein n=1 Tax=Xenopus laevis TaxID=8355 RepID=A0A974BWR9_XENLA|nr:hypothetical protein XELAEV_18047937mg [Xenopus laevis]